MNQNKIYGNILESAKTLADFQKKNMILIDFDKYKKVNKILPDKIYCNKKIVSDLYKVFDDLIKSKLIKEIITYDGCFNPRYIRGMETKKILSNHAFGTALDFNSALNPLGIPRNKLEKPFSVQFTDIWKMYNFQNGFTFARPDGMHFEYTK